MANKVNYAELPARMSSKYLSEGFARDIMQIRDVKIDSDERTIRAKMDLNDPYVSFYGEHPEFFLSVTTAYRFVNQLINAYVCETEREDKAKLGKFFAIYNEMRTIKPIKTPRDIEARVACTKDLRRGDKRFMEFQFEVQGGAFKGKIRGCGAK